MEVGECSLAPAAPAPSPPPPSPAPGVGILEIEVTHASVCWDTSPDGSASPHEGAQVVVRSGGRTRNGTTDDQGRATIENIPTGSATVEVSHVGYVSQTLTETINADATTSTSVEIQLSATGRGCNRQHTQEPTATPTIAAEDQIFWASWWPIIILHVVWLLAMLLLVVFTIVAIVDIVDGTMHFEAGGFSIVAVFLGTVAFLSHIIFGELVGIPLMILAGLSWLAMIGLTIASALGALPNIPVNIVWFPTLCALWVAFFAGMIAGRTDSFTAEHHAWYIVIFLVVGFAVGVALYWVLAYFTPTFWANGDKVGWYFLALFFTALIWAAIGGTTGHVIVNDHNLESFTEPEPRRLLPFAGHFHCVQGNRGWFSHFNTELLCYDFEVPEGEPVLAIDEGHVIKWRDDARHSLYNEDTENWANFIWVQHRDGTVSRYLHLKRDGVRSVNPVLDANSMGSTGLRTSDVHVHAGQVLGHAGSTGMSRFPHIHLGVYGTADAKVGLMFRDASTQRHGGKCYTFRSYQSDNANRGPISL